MAGDRLIVACALVAAATACRDAAADGEPSATAASAAHDPQHGIDVPGGWRELPEVAGAAVDAARDALGKGDHDVHAHAWGDPARGCYLAIVEVRGAGRATIPELTKQLEEALGGSLELTAWTTSPDVEDRAVIDARFAAPAHAASGLVRAELVLDERRVPRALAAACFHNDRQPATCEDACAPLLAMLRRAASTSGASPAPQVP